MVNLREVMRLLPMGVVIITTMDNGKPFGMTANTFNSISLEPELVTFLADKSKGNDIPFKDAERFCVNFIDDEKVLEVFAFSGLDKRFSSVKWEITQNGVPVLENSYAFIEAIMEKTVDIADHSIIIGKVINSSIVRKGKPIVWYMRKFTTLEDY
ncbi:flavin reductase [Sulfolobales archaeon HS-7]|nr:flavin reductase [Sulfolobales archaeon HS-7]